MLSWVVFLLFAGGLFAVEAIVTDISLNHSDQQQSKITLQMGKLEQTVKAGSVKILSPGGRELSVRDLRRRDRVEVKFKGRDIIEIRLQGK
jgi:hypothetical protein